MIILFDEAETKFESLGIGILRDASDATVIEKLNDEFTLSLSYPITGVYYNEIKIGRIICAKPNPYDSFQPFRIQTITKPISGIVTVMAYHISYDMNGIPCKAIEGTGLNDVLNKLQNGTKVDDNKINKIALIDNDFAFSTNVTSNRSFKTTAPYNMRAILMGDNEHSLLGVYDAEVKFDKYHVMINSKRGKNRGATVKYGHNMTDLKHESNNDKLYNGVFPYYHKESTSTETVTEESFKQVYIVGTKPYQEDWLAYSEKGEAYHPLDNTPVQIMTEGEYYQKVVSWNEPYKKYDEKIYNQSVTLMEGMSEPTWIRIDWSRFPVVSCRANAVGYFKTVTDEKWSEKRGPGDEIFSGNILSGGLSGMVSNLVIYFSEVIPSGSESVTKDVSEIVDVILDENIIWLNTSDTRNMKYNRVLSLDLSSEFDEEPTKEKLRAKAEEYISKHMVGTLNHTTSVSFIDLAKTTDKDKYTNFDNIELGDTVKIIYEALDVNTELRVIKTEYNPINDSYVNIELGKKSDKLSDTTIQNGDSISSLSNDVGYADITTVNKLIADTVTAEYINAANANLSRAQIEQLQVEKIECKGIIEASQFTLDQLVAKLLIAENAQISNELAAGTVRVSGDITVKSGSITINGDNGTTFTVDRDGNVLTNSIEITGGSLSINNGAFEVTNDGVLTATAGTIGNCEIDEEGNLKVPSAFIDGSIKAVDIDINDTFKVNNEGEVTIKSGSIQIGKTETGYKFEVDNYGDVNINSGSININSGNFVVDKYGNVTIKSGSIDINNGKFSVDSDGRVIATSGVIGNCEIDVNGNLKVPTINLNGDITANAINLNNTFKVDNLGNVTITSGSINLGNKRFTGNGSKSTISEGYSGSINLKTGMWFDGTYYRYNDINHSCVVTIDSKGNLIFDSYDIIDDDDQEHEIYFNGCDTFSFGTYKYITYISTRGYYYIYKINSISKNAIHVTEAGSDDDILGRYIFMHKPSGFVCYIKNGEMRFLNNAGSTGTDLRWAYLSWDASYIPSDSSNILNVGNSYYFVSQENNTFNEILYDVDEDDNWTFRSSVLSPSPGINTIYTDGVYIYASDFSGETYIHKYYDLITKKWVNIEWNDTTKPATVSEVKLINDKLYFANNNYSTTIYLYETIYDYPFSVDQNGNATMKSANLTGAINSTSGVISGFTINNNALYTGTYSKYGDSLSHYGLLISSFDDQGTNGLISYNDDLVNVSIGPFGLDVKDKQNDGTPIVTFPSLDVYSDTVRIYDNSNSLNYHKPILGCANWNNGTWEGLHVSSNPETRPTRLITGYIELNANESKTISLSDVSEYFSHGTISACVVTSMDGNISYSTVAESSVAFSAAISGDSVIITNVTGTNHAATFIIVAKGQG